MNKLKKNQVYTVDIDSYSAESFGVCRIEGCVVFVPGAIPGEKWEIKLLKVNSDSAYAKGERLLIKSDSRTAPECPFFGACGGCDTWHINYEEELRFKLQKVNSALKHIGKQSVQTEEILGSEKICRYRNKGIFAVGKTEEGASFGFFRQRSHQLIAIESCLIQNELSERAAKTVTAFMNEHGIMPYDELSGKGAVRHVFCRCAEKMPSAVLCIVSARGFGYNTGALVDRLREECPELTGIVLNINKAHGNAVLEGDFYTLWGEPNLNDMLCGFSFSIAPQAFFQVNPAQAQRLYEKAMEYAAEKPISLALDLYCGAGTISLLLAKYASQVIAAEIVPEAIENAQKNALENGVENVEFICADAGQAAENLAARKLRPDVVVVDPPRKGMLPNAIEAVAEMSPERIVYVSCDPATLSRDILRFQQYGFALRSVTAVDMFPRTRHVECVALLNNINRDM